VAEVSPRRRTEPPSARTPRAHVQHRRSGRLAEQNEPSEEGSGAGDMLEASAWGLFGSAFLLLGAWLTYQLDLSRGAPCVSDGLG